MYFETGRARGNRQPLITELTDDVKRLARRLLEREPELVRRDRALDLGAHVRCCLEEAISGHEPIERLVRPLKVVVADEMFEPALRVDDVREYRTAEKLVPQRLPESLDLAERLRVLGPAADVVDAHARQQLLEFGLAAPHRVLPTVVGQHLGRLTVRRDAALERLHDECRLLMVRERVTDHEATVVVHEHADVQALGAAQPEREDVGLPELVRCRAFEAPRRVFALRFGLGRLDETFAVQNLPHLVLAHAKRLEAREHVADSPRAPVIVFTLDRDHLFTLDRVRCLRANAVVLATRLETRRSFVAERLHPFRDRGLRYAERVRHIVQPGAAQALLDRCQLVRRGQLSPGSRLFRFRHLVLPFCRLVSAVAGGQVLGD